MAQDDCNAVLRAAKLPDGYDVRRPGAAMIHASVPRYIRGLNIWRVAAALKIDMVAAIKSGALTRDTPLDLLHSMTRRCAACDMADACERNLRTSDGTLQCPPKFCRIKNRLADLVNQIRPGRSQAS